VTADPAIEIRHLEPGELAAYWDTAVAAFGWEDPHEDMGVWLGKLFDPERSVGAFDGRVLVGVAGAYPFRMSTPGADVAAAGITLVGVLPSHRRRGILTRMMGTLYDDALAHGEPVALLWASEDPIYQRFGFGMAALLADMDVERHRAVFRENVPPAGRVRMIEMAEALEVLPPIYEQFRQETPGAFARTAAWWEGHRLRDRPEERSGASRLRIGLWELDGAARGYALWRVHPRWEGSLPRGRLEVLEAVGLDPVATREVWRFLFSIDLVERVTAEHLPVDHPLQYLLAEPRRLGLALTWPLWVRVLDVKAALEARRYAVDGDLVLGVTDVLLPANTGRWLVEVRGGRARCGRTELEVDLEVSANDLGATYFGSTTFAALARAGRVAEGATGGALDRADALFRWGRAPWCPEIF
jgi:predicted acetyltransferase